MKQRESWNKGKKMPPSFGEKVRQSLIGKTGILSRNWKGDKAGYVAIHTWVKKNMGMPQGCSINQSHKGKRYEWASISRHPNRAIEDWITMCPSCHRKYDINKLTLEQLRNLYE